MTVDSNGNLTVAEQSVSTSSVTVTCVCNSIMYITTQSEVTSTGTGKNCQVLYCHTASGVLVLKINSPSVVDGNTASYISGNSSSGGTID